MDVPMIDVGPEGRIRIINFVSYGRVNKGVRKEEKESLTSQSSLLGIPPPFIITNKVMDRTGDS